MNTKSKRENFKDALTPKILDVLQSEAEIRERHERELSFQAEQRRKEAQIGLRKKTHTIGGGA
jgi:hypothetical protein